MKMSITPRPYQLKGVRKISHFKGRCLLADEMGLGKTTQSLIWISENQPWPVVIVCQAIVKLTWELEAASHFGLNATVLHGKTPRQLNPTKHKLIVINYDILGSWWKTLRKLKPKLVVIDEVHYIKNFGTQRTKAVRNLVKGVKHVIGLGGTPIEKGLPAELFSVLNILRPDIWDSWMTYARRYCKPTWTGYQIEYKGATRTGELNKKLKQHVLIRRLKKDVLKDLPPKIRIVVPLEIIKRKEYEQAKNEFRRWLAKTHRTKQLKTTRAEQLVKVGYLLRLTAQLKLHAVMAWLEDYLDTSNQKILLFCTHLATVEALKQAYDPISVVMTGKTSHKDRQKAIERFKLDKKVRIMITTLKEGWNGGQVAGAVGIVEFPWVPTALGQVEDRVHRFGQKNKVTCYYFPAVNTIEEKLCNLLQSRDKDVKSILDGKKRKQDFNIFDQLLDEIEGGAK